MEFLCEYDLNVHYIKGKGNMVADALRRRHNEVSFVTTCINWRERVLHNVLEDELYVEVYLLVQS